MKKNQIAFCLLLMLACFSQFARGQSWTDVISGPSNACVSSITSYTVTPAAGYTYDWSVDVGGNLLTSNPGNPASFQWTVPGTSTVKVVGHNPAGLAVDSGIYTVTICAIPAPFIATYYQVACQSLDSTVRDPQRGDDPEPYVLTDEDGCIQVCAQSKVTYLAYGPAGSTFHWVVTGGTIIGSSTSPTVLVQWGVPGTGNITLEDIGPGPCNCIGYASICIDIIPKPHAAFAIAPNTTQVTTFNGCIGTSLVFTDLSTYLPGSPIVSWFWNFADGTFASDENPTHSYSVGGTYNAYLVVANACGCTDTARTQIIINPLTGPTIECPHVVCQNDTCSYTTTTTCGSGVYSWNVVGGTIISGIGTPTILVQWAPTASGFGYVELYVAGCAACPETTSVKIPIVESTPVLTGPTSPVCINTQIQYSIPLWPGVQYHWGLIGDPSAIISYHNSNAVTLEFTTPGTYTLHGWWESRTNLCGGDLKYKIIVEGPPAVVGPDTVCTGTTETYSLSPSSSGNWVLNCPAPTPTQTGTGSTFTGSFPVPGTYTLTVSGAGMCTPPPLIINAAQTPPPPDAISGPSQVCFGQPATYTATTSASGSLFAWSITAGSGTFSPSTGNTVTVIWTAPGTITVQRQGLIAPFCLSSGLSINVTEYPLTFSVTGPDPVCANSTGTYTDGYTIADATTWAITPTTAGSVTSGIYDPTCTILWNNTTVALTATVTATAQKCGIPIPETMTVNILPAPINSIIAIPSTLPYCNGQTVEFYDPTGVGAATYAWDFGDGGTGTGNPVYYTFNTSASGFSPIPDVITLITTGAAAGYCAPTGVATYSVSVIPGPYANISYTGGNLFCTGSTITTTLNAVVTNCGSPTFQWYDGVTPVGTGLSTYVVPGTAAGNYWCQISDASVPLACAVNTNTVTVAFMSCGGGGCSSPPVIGLTYTVTCNAVHVESTGPAGTLISWSVTPGYTYYYASTGPAPYTLDLVYPIAEDVNVTLLEGFTPCTSAATISIPVPLQANYHYNYSCTNPYTLNLTDESGILAPFTVSSILWSSSPPLSIPSGSPASVAPTPGPYDISETITVSNGSQVTTCTTTQTVNVPTVSSISFTEATSPVCEGVPIVFTETVGGSSTYGLPDWNYGDGAVYIGADPSTRTYSWSSGGGDPNIDPVTVSITNAVGCTYTATNTVQIYENKLNGTVTPATPNPLVSCGAPINLYYTPNAGTEVPGFYLWSDGSNFDPDAASVTGSYFVTVSDIYQCQFVTEPQNVVILGLVPLAISCLTEVCYPDAVHLSGFVGTAGYTYQWWRSPSGGPIPGATGPTLTDAGLSPGTYTYWLVVTNTFESTVCTYTSATYTVTVNAPPVAPTVALTPLSCSPYEVEMTASSSVVGAIYTWSSGATGATTTLTSGGAIRTWLFDPSDGCTSYTDSYVPPDPGSLADWIPTGCYMYCSNFVTGGGLTLYGPPGPFDAWEWLNYGAWDGSGVTSDVNPLSILTAGDYQLSLTSGGCTQVMGGMDVTLNPYCQCPTLLKTTTIICDPSSGNPAGYQITFYFSNPGLAVNAVIGMNIGPLYTMPINIPAGGSMATYNFTTFDVPPPASTNGWIAFASSTGTCYEQFTQALPTCTWVAERGSEPQQPAGSGSMPAAMMVYPNPAKDQVTVSYNYGSASATAERRIVVYDVYGRTIASQPVTEVSGACNFGLADLAAGVYIIKMEENGHSVELQRLTVTH